MPNNTEIKSAANVAILLVLEYENPVTTVRYCRYDTDLVVGGNTYTSKPQISCKSFKRDGSTESEVREIELETDAFLSKLKTTFPTVTVSVYEYDPISDQSYLHYKGILSRATFNDQGKQDVVTLHVTGPKGQLNTTVSLAISGFCGWIFGSSPCQFNLAAAAQTRTITGIQENKITLSVPLTLDTNYWKNGTVKYRGFELSIHSQTSGTEFYLVRPCVPHWLNQAVVITPGCDGTLDSCTKRGQLSNFSGIGLKLPTRDIRIHGN